MYNMIIVVEKKSPKNVFFCLCKQLLPLVKNIQKMTSFWCTRISGKCALQDSCKCLIVATVPPKLLNIHISLVLLGGRSVVW